MIKRAKKPYPFRPQTYKRLFPRALPWMIKQKVIATLTDLPTALHDIELSQLKIGEMIHRKKLISLQHFRGTVRND